MPNVFSSNLQSRMNMNRRAACCLAIALLSLPGYLVANNPFTITCERSGCNACKEGSGGTCSPDQQTHIVSQTFRADEQAAAAEFIKRMEDAGYTCSIGEVNSVESKPPSGGSGQPQPAGVSTDNYKRSSLTFTGASPDYVKTEMANGVRTPQQVPIKGATRFYSDLPDGFQAAQYPNSQLNAPDANGFRTPKPNAQPSSITIHRNPDGGVASTQGRLDIVHKARHPQSGAWVTGTIRKTAPRGNNNWSTAFYLGDPAADTSLAPYREIAITRTPNADGTETAREITRDRDTGGTLVITSDITRTYAFYKYGEPVILSETRHTGTGFEPTTTWTYYQNPSDPASFNKPATMRQTGGAWSNTTYQGNPVTGILVTKTVSGWRDNPAPAIGTAPDENANRVVVEIEARNETGTFGREEKIEGITVSKSWGERHKANSGEIVETTRVVRGAATLTTVSTAYPDDDSATSAERGRLKSVLHPDGTLTLVRYAAHGDNRVETVDTGVGTAASVTDGTRTVSTYTKDDVLISQTTEDIASGIQLSARHAIAFDSNGIPTRWAYDNDPDDYSETLRGCCGIDSERSRDGIATSYTHDGLKRPKTVVSLGITTTRTYGSAEIGGITFPSTGVTRAAGGLTVNEGTAVYDHAGRPIRQISPDLDGDGTPETTATTYTSPTETGTLYPNGGTSVSTTYLDGQPKSVSGTAAADASYQYAVGTDLDGIPGAVMKTTLTRPSGTAAGNLVTETYSAVGGLTLAVKTNSVTTATYAYDTLARPILSTDGDGVKSHTAYNAKGEAYRRAASRDGNDTIDIGTDIVTDTVTDIADVPGFGPAVRTRVIRWTGADSSLVSTSLRSPDGAKSASYSPGVAAPATTLAAAYLDRTDGAWTDTSTAPDGTKQTTTYANWLPVAQASLGTDDGTLESSSTGYDALRRPETSTDSRTEDHVIRRTAYHPANGLVVSVTEDLAAAGAADRVTLFEYDNMGRTVTTTLPDTTKTRHTYTLTGQSEATWGSQAYPTFATYDEQGRLKELRTFANLTPAQLESENLSLGTLNGYATTTWLYYPNGRLQQKKDAAGKGASYTYTPAGRILTRLWARGRLTTYTHTQGFLTGISYTGDDTTWAAYGAAAENWETVNTDPASTQQQKDAALAAMNDAYTAFAAEPDASTPAVGFTHDNLGRKDVVTQAGVTTADYEYTGAFLTSEILGSGNKARTLARHYDAVGRPRSLAVGQEYSTAYGYDTGGRLNRIWDHPVLDQGEPQGNPAFTYGYTPDSFSLLHTVTGPVHTVTNTYDITRGVLATKANAVTAGTPSVPSSFAYGVNAIGQRETVDPVSGMNSTYTSKWTWDYDSMGQITTANDRAASNHRAYQFDSIGNREKTSEGTLTLPPGDNWNSNDLNQLTIANGTALPEDSYDFDGNQLKSRILPPGAEASSACVFVWDGENRLVAVKDPGGAALVSYAYDAFSRLVSRTTIVNNQPATTRYLYDGWNRIAEYAGQSLRTTYIWGMDLSGTFQGAGGVGGLLSVSAHDPETGNVTSVHYPTCDGNGNITEYLTATGDVAAHFEYDPFGNTLAATGDAAQFEYRFSTKPQDSATGLLYYGYRWYDPLTGRWPSRDPIAEKGGLNLYGFVGNNGVKRWDKLGMENPDLGNTVPCTGTCGADISDWIMDEIRAQVEGWEQRKRLFLNNSPSITDYLKWANGNQRYKDANFFKFNQKLDGRCGTGPKLPGCGNSVTLCNRCVRSAILGNIMYGLIGRIDFMAHELVQGATVTKENLFLRVDDYDKAAYVVGANIAVNPNDVRQLDIPTTLEDFCARLKASLESPPLQYALEEGNGKGRPPNTLRSCGKCPHKTMETRHGGKEFPRLVP